MSGTSWILVFEVDFLGVDEEAMLASIRVSPISEVMVVLDRVLGGVGFDFLIMIFGIFFGIWNVTEVSINFRVLSEYFSISLNITT